jgi:hypothetical protein
MELVEVHELVGRVAAVDAGCADRLVLEAAVGELRRLKSWVEGREVAVARGLAVVSSFPGEVAGRRLAFQHPPSRASPASR